MPRTLPARALCTLALALFGSLALSVAAEACARPSVSGGDTVISADRRIDQGKVDAAIRAEVNYHRCKAGLKPLKGAASLARVAQTHAKWMARARTVTHNSSVGGQATVKARIVSTGIKLRAGSENIGMVHRYQIDGSSFRIHDAAACGFATASGQPIPPHSYNSLARTMVGLWMKSSGHRRNILDPKVSMVATAVGFAAGAPYCGQFYLSQDFAG